MKYWIIISKHEDTIDFYMRDRGTTYYLFSQPFSKGVYDYFRNGRCANEILSFNKWRTNKRLNKTIERIPSMVHYVQNEVA